ncbi:Beta-1,3-galactosyltransferase 1 [Holothuria leucospilota]|uniref:Hexosyltransferase n=1 Tax=Holothuria leucospilota TaxID=206669 RepID=A0A9Q1C6P9_HOLLE|nr:Beta-1,3-galactosyltransferase 1 [Holothuria leucospilota]
MKCRRLPATRVFSVMIATVWVMCILCEKLWSRPIRKQFSDESGIRNGKLTRVTLDNIKFVINEPNRCNPTEEKSAPLFLLVLMHSASGNFEQRERHRFSCLKVSEVSGKGTASLFLLGESGDETVNSRIKEESGKYKDIIMGNFLDSYQNLTLKTLMGLKWASAFCPLSKYVMKADDDGVINFKNVVNLLSTTPSSKYIVGHLFNKNRPVRDPTNKWFISEKDYPGLFYPPYLNGIAYVMSGDLAGSLFQVSHAVPLFPLEDVYVGMLLERLRIEAISDPCFIYNNEFNDNLCPYLTSCAVQLKQDPETVFVKCNALAIDANTSCLSVICYNRFAMIRNKSYPECNGIKYNHGH